MIRSISILLAIVLVGVLAAQPVAAQTEQPYIVQINESITTGDGWKRVNSGSGFFVDKFIQRPDPQQSILGYIYEANVVGQSFQGVETCNSTDLSRFDSCATRRTLTSNQNGLFCVTFGLQFVGQQICQDFAPSATHINLFYNSGAPPGTKYQNDLLYLRPFISDDCMKAIDCNATGSVTLQSIIMHGLPPLDAQFTATPITGSAPLAVDVVDTSDGNGNILTWTWDYGDGSQPIQTNDPNNPNPPTYTYNAGGIYTLSLTIADGSGRTDTASITITVIEVEYVRPFVPDLETGLSVASDDLLKWWKDDVIVSTAPISIGDSDPPDIHAAISGTVQLVERIEPSTHCTRIVGSSCILDDYDLPIDKLGDARIVSLYTPIGTANTIQHIVRDPIVDIGDEVLAGCPIGSAVYAVGDSSTVALAILRGQPMTPQPIDQLDTTTESIINDMVLAPDPNEDCIAVTNVNGSCLNSNALFRDGATDWNLNGSRLDGVSNGQIHLPPGTSISQTLSGLFQQSYFITVSTQGRGQLELTFGTESQTITSSVDFPDYQTHDFVFSPAAPGGGLTILRIDADMANLGDVTVNVFCVSDTPPPGTAPSSACYFGNERFEYNLAGWGYLNPVGTPNRGLVEMGDGGAIFQDVLLYEGDYKLRITYGESVYDGTAPANMGTLTVSWGGSSQNLSPPVVEYTDIDTGRDVQTMDFSATDPNGTLSAFTFTTVGVPAGSRLALDRVCIEAIGSDGQPGGRFPGFEDAPTYNQVIGGDANRPYCETVNRPQRAIDLGAWINWIWANITNFNRCQLMPGIETAIDGVFNLGDVMVSLGNWLSATSGSFMALMGAVTRFIAGHILNLALSTLDYLEYFRTIAERVWDVTKRILSGLVWLFENLVLLITTMFTNIDLVRQAWQNASPLTIEGAPDCLGNPQDNGFCAGIWVLDNTIMAQFEPGDIALRLISATMWIHAIIWLIKSNKQTMTNVSGSS